MTNRPIEIPAKSIADRQPRYVGKGKKVHHSFPGPAATDQLNDFHKVRDDIEREITKLLKQFE